MNKKLSRFEIIAYCEKCKHVKKTGSSTLCGLTNDFAKFDYECDKFIDTKLQETNRKIKVLRSWISPFILCVLSGLTFFAKSTHGNLHIGSLVVLAIGIIWFIVAFIRIIRV